MNNQKTIQKIVLGGVIFNKQSKVLILQRNKNEDVFPDMWELPSGKKELLEDSENCLLREIKEETGLDVEIVMPFHVFDYQIKKNDEVRDTSQINFLVRMKRVSSVKISHEHQAFAWIEKEELDKYNLSVKTKETIRKAFELAYKIND